MGAVGSRSHHSPLPELQTAIPAWFRSWLTWPSRSLKEQAQRSTMIEGLSAVTLATHDMRRAVCFYHALGFEVLYGGEASSVKHPQIKDPRRLRRGSFISTR